MSGFTDAAFRLMCRRGGADVCVSEFVHARALLSEAKKIMEKLNFSEEERPYGIQIFGSDPSEIADAAAFVEEKFRPDFVDINFGCPAPNAVDAGAGSALLKDPKVMARIAETTARSLKKIPLSAKMRTGWGAQTILPDAALMLQDSGVQALALHGRSKVQGYAGDADWKLIEDTASVLKIPLIGNGSVEKLTSDFFAQSKCAGFMLGRAALGNPWIFKEIRAKMKGDEFVAPTPKERIEAAKFYLEKISGGLDDFNIINYKPNLMSFLKGAAGFKKMRIAITESKYAKDIFEILEHFNFK